MARVPILTVDTATPATQSTLTKIEKAVGGMIPSMFAAVANSPAALQSMWGSFGAFSTGALGAALTEQIAVAVADTNDCRYCLAAHTALGTQAGLSAAELATAQQGHSDDPSIDALLQFAHSLVQQRGEVAESEIVKLRELGWTDSQIVETIAQVGLNLFTNYINIALDVPVDFPEVPFQR
ncbi:carboxymuconolactone decarboxylase family protein [Leucobacter sp. G161]|uniref:carboxymuconolactone decarboxylase family protein n=1 Tax=Leucobacter sp. G161 TaxID=663704 RepID=UPI00073BAF60|nr:carboxymuconolactone decarboxylase family protein [Leucobacter sp. G161]KUF05859.1 carboxymuconolactone decarboxylase [Leucobacter sp. G161]